MSADGMPQAKNQLGQARQLTPDPETCGQATASSSSRPGATQARSCRQRTSRTQCCATSKQTSCATTTWVAPMQCRQQKSRLARANSYYFQPQEGQKQSRQFEGGHLTLSNCYCSILQEG